MILSRKLSNALNDQINAEMWSSNLYMSMAVHFTVLGMEKCASWMREKQIEEIEHAYELMEYSVRNGGQVVIGVINAVPTGYGTPQEVYEHAVKHQEHLANLVKKVMDIAETDNDTVTQDFLKDYAHRQVERSSAESILERIKECSGESLDIIDHQIDER